METIEVGGIRLEVAGEGSGPPLLFLHAGQFIRQARPFVASLAKSHKVWAPLHPGFSPAPVPQDFRSVEDLAYLYLDLLDRLDVRDAVVVGSSFGAWIALEMAVRNTSRIGRMALVSPVGVKLADREERDFADIFYLSDNDYFGHVFADPARWAPKYSELASDAVEQLARERQAIAYYAWKPYLHNPGLKRWLHRVSVGTLVVAGEQDRFTMPGYAEKLTARLPNASMKLISRAGHFPHIEQCEATVAAIAAG